VESALFGHLKIDPSLPAFAPERRDAAMEYIGLACPCGGSAFHLSGWPRVASGGGSFFWRSVARVWREARLPMQDGEPAESPFFLPLFARCDGCLLESVLLDGPLVVGQWPLEQRSEPRESLRCRACRRGSVEIVVGQAADPAYASRVDFEVVVRCVSCLRQARVAWSDGGRPSEQEIRLDQLYGRR